MKVGFIGLGRMGTGMAADLLKAGHEVTVYNRTPGITHINEGFDFLGQNLRKYDGKPLVKPSKKNTHAFLEKVRGIIDVNKSASQTVLIGLLNPVIRGWANYHQHCAAKETFDRVDHEIWRALWPWARRRHPKKARDWVKKHCFPAMRNRAWTFATKTDQRTADGKPIWLRLVYAGETKIRRHVKVRQDANPFDPQYRPYFEERAPQKKFGLNRRDAGSAHVGLCIGLSRMRGNSNVR